MARRERPPRSDRVDHGVNVRGRRPTPVRVHHRWAKRPSGPVRHRSSSDRTTGGTVRGMGALIVAGARTPIGKLSGAFATLSAADLGAVAIGAALERAGVAPDEVDHVIMGQVLMAGQGQVPSRQAAVKAGIPMSVPAVNVNKVCLSGLNAIYLANQMIAAGDADDRGGRRHGVDDQRALPRRRGAGRLPLRQRPAARRDHRRRVVVRVRLVPDGPRHRPLQRRRREPRAPGRLRRAVARAGGECDQGGPTRRRDRAGVDPAAPRRAARRRARRGRASRHHRREPRRAAAGVRRRRHRHRRQRQPAVRRRQRGDRDVARRGRAPRRHAARRVRRLRHGRRSRLGVAAAPAERGDHRGAGEGRARRRRRRPVRDQRGVRRRRDRVDGGPRHHRRGHQRQRRGDRPRASDRDERQPPRPHRPPRAAPPRRRHGGGQPSAAAAARATR